MLADVKPRLTRRLAVLAATAVALPAAAVAVTITPAAAATVDTGAYYVFVNRHSGKAMDLWNWSTADGGEIRQFSRLDGNNQQFQFVDVGSGYYQLRNRHSGKVVTVPNSNDGVQVTQVTASSDTKQHWRLADSANGDVRFVNRHSNKVLDLWGWSTADGAMISQYADLDGANQRWQLVRLSGGTNPTPPPNPGPQTGLVGWATQNGGTTGGGNAGTTTVTSASALTSALNSSSAAVIRVSGTINCSGMLRVRSNKTILGNSGATIAGCGFNINGDRNVIIRNLTFRNWDDDAINVQESATNIWIDHNSFTAGYDGAVDIKRGSDFITVSWNRVYGHDKSMLLGHSDDNASQDAGHLRVSYHHNWFDGSNQRHPRVRFGNPVHVYNNYYSNVRGYGVASTMNAGVLVEGNYFENTPDPYHLGEGSSGPGSLVARNNHFVNSGGGQTGGSVAGIPYSYTLDTPSNVKSIVTGGAGAGRISV
ncbi:RICIN domain-containing protein [Micromonospora sp. C95]|uniref:pectate lyase family protein n=1 Tax=Micromonospora sp. C95 TaxID=2824882 RepID=UPI001B37F496|nr:RICIN domain-containing protein [Micromonospora sp. C95]MBQ1026655.1 RICIN domain-containing protein [Micromonospora sp. C95]